MALTDAIIYILNLKFDTLLRLKEGGFKCREQSGLQRLRGRKIGY